MITTNTSSAQTAQQILHPATSIHDLTENGPRIIERAQGCHIVDSTGKHYLDAVAGLWCMNIGYGRESVSQAMADASRQLAYYHTFAGTSNPPQIALAEKLASLVPDNLGHIFYGSSGSDGNDTLMKIVWYYNALRGQPEKRKIIARHHAYHGTSVATASLTGLPSFHKGFGLPIDDIEHVSTPHYYRYGHADETEWQYSQRLANELDQRIQSLGAEHVAAFIAEPVMGAGGVIPPPEGYFQSIQAVLKKHDVLLIVDEVVCGFGRLGTMFGHEHYGIQPDLMNTAKGLTSGYFPLSAVFISDTVYDVLKTGSADMGAFAHGYTYSGHPVGCAVALENLRILASEQLVENAATCGRYLQEQLQHALGEHPHVGEIRGQGFIAGVQLIEERDTRKRFNPAHKMAAKVTQVCAQQGLILRPLPTADTIAMSPPLTFTQDNVDELVDKLCLAVNNVLG